MTGLHGTYDVTFRDGKFWCQCEAGKYKGQCKHILALRVDRNAGQFLPRELPKLEPIERKTWDAIWPLERMIAEPLVIGQRVIIVFGLSPALFDTQLQSVFLPVRITEEAGFTHAGTVIDGVIDERGVLMVYDIPRWKGTRIDFMPCWKRYESLRNFVKEVHSPDIILVPWAYEEVDKFCMRQLHGESNLVLKDAKTKYGEARAWFVLQSGGKSR